MPPSEQENVGLLGSGGEWREEAGCSVLQTSKAVAPFRFHAPRCHIDWRALHALDLAAVVRHSDIDALESVLDVVAGGDIEAEDARSLTPANFIQLFRTAQLTLDYLLHVQDRLAGDASTSRREAARLRQQVQLLQLKVKEVREELVGTRREARHLKKSMRRFEALALAHQHAPPPPPEVRVVERVVQVADPAAMSKLEKVEGQMAQLVQERQGLQRDNSKLTDALATAVAAQAAAEGSTEKAVGLARREEQAAASQRLEVALEGERKRLRDSKTKLSVVLNGEGSSELQSKLEAAQRREREAEERAEAAALEAARSSKAPMAEVRRLRAQLESAQAEADVLRSRLAEAERDRSPKWAGAHSAAYLAERAAAADVLEQQVERLREEKATLREECRRLRQQTAQDTAEITHLTRRLLQVVASRGSSSQPGSRSGSPTKAAAAAAAAGGDMSGSGSVKQADAGGLGGIGSPIEGGAVAAAAESELQAGSPPKGAASQRAGSRPGSARGLQRPGSPGAGSPSLHGQSEPLPSPSSRRQFRREMRHALANAERPGVVSRFPHSLGTFLALRPDLEEELEAELAAELASFGLDPAARQLSDSQLEAAMVQLERRRSEARDAMSAIDRQRMNYMRSTATWHVQRMAELAGNQRDASPVKRPVLVPPPSLKPIRTASREEERVSPRRRGYVEQVLDQVGDEDATYSPLGQGASVLSDRGYFDDAGTPRSTGSWGPAVPDSAGAPRSPWAITHDRVLYGGEEMVEGSQSPLAQAASRSRSASPSKRAKSVQFSGLEGPGGGGMAAAQRIGRRPSFGEQSAQSPSSHRIQRQAQEITAAEPWDSRDWDTREAEAVRPPSSRYSRGGSGL